VSVRRRPVVFAALLALPLLLAAPRARAGAESAVVLLQEARENEADHNDLGAIRRYSEAIELDPTLGDAYLGLGALRMRRGDTREAERVFDVALSHVPSLFRALVGRAEARWAIGNHADAESDLEAYVLAAQDPGALRELAGWYGQEARAPAQLATWRRIRSLATERADGALRQEAQKMVRALQILVGAADPVTMPAAVDPIRRAIARVAKRGG
jgi:tetratricopeptide (TPR) repeat protein